MGKLTVSLQLMRWIAQNVNCQEFHPKQHTRLCINNIVHSTVTPRTAYAQNCIINVHLVDVFHGHLCVMVLRIVDLVKMREICAALV